MPFLYIPNCLHPHFLTFYKIENDMENAKIDYVDMLARLLIWISFLVVHDNITTFLIVAIQTSIHSPKQKRGKQKKKNLY